MNEEQEKIENEVLRRIEAGEGTVTKPPAWAIPSWAPAFVGEAVMSQPQGQSQYSEDRRWWWDGYRWWPVPQPKPIPRTSPWVWALVGAAILTILWFGYFGADQAISGLTHASDGLVNWANGLQPK
jgi:hypothetical protein